MRRLLTLGQPHRNTAIRAHLQSRRSLALLVVLLLCLSAFVLAANEAWAKEQPSRAAEQGPGQGKDIANGKVAEPVPGTPTPVASPPAQVPPAVTPPVQKPPVENAPPPPTSETPPPADKPSPPPLQPTPSTPEPDPAPQPTPQPTPQPAPQAGGEEDVESGPVPNTSQPPITDSDRLVEHEPVSAASPNIVDEVEEIIHDLAPTPAPAMAMTPAAADEGHVAGPAPDPVLPLPASAAASDQVLPATSEGLAALVRGLVTEQPATPPATAPMAQWGDGGPLTTFTNNKPAAAVVAATVAATVAAPVVGEALRLSSSLGTVATGALGSAVGTVPSAAANAAASVASATAEVFRTLTGGSAAGSSSTDATSGNQQAPSDGTPQQPAPLAPLLGGAFSPFTGAAGQLGAGGGLAPLLVGILALLTVSLTRRDFRTYFIACEMPKPSSALLRPLERPG